MEVTKWLKPSDKRVTIYGDSASVQAVTRVNAEQSSKRTMRRPTRQPFRGRLGGRSEGDLNACGNKEQIIHCARYFMGGKKPSPHGVGHETRIVAHGRRAHDQ